MGKGSIITLVLLGFFALLGLGGSSSSEQEAQPVTQVVEEQQSYVEEPVETDYEEPTYESDPGYEDSEPELSNDNYYTNSEGEEVHSPAYTEDNSVPSGASAQCEDGTYSFSQSRRGTCSHHGGVAMWL